MKSTKTTILFATIMVSALGVVLDVAPADAAVCRSRMSGQGTGTGLFGQGSTLARQNALADWSNKVAARHGQRFASSAKARSVAYDCRQGAILQAKCVVTAVPCR